MTEIPIHNAAYRRSRAGSDPCSTRGPSTRRTPLPLQVARANLSKARSRQVPEHQMGGHDRDAGRLLRPAWIRLDRGPAFPIKPSCSISPISGCISSRWKSGRRNSTTSPDPRDFSAGAVHGHRDRGPRLVRLCLPADGLDRPHGPGRAALAGRPQRAHQARQIALVLRQALAPPRHASEPGLDRPFDGRRLHLLFPRRARACLGALAR